MSLKPLRVSVVAAALLATAPAAAETNLIFKPDEASRLRLEFPLFDAPFNVAHGYSFPSQHQATWITTDFYELAHYGIAQLWNPFSASSGTAALGMTVTSVFDGLTFFFAGPLGAAWNHEEWHRAVLSRRGEQSGNPLSTSFGAPLLKPVAVEITPETTDRVKATHPADFALVSVAGFHAHYALAHQLEKNAFFHDQQTVSSFIIGLNYMLPSVYYLQCLSDAPGGDCALQVRHFFSPSESSADRPLTAPEQSYMTMQLGLSMLNFLDPFLFMIRAFETSREDGSKIRWNAAVRHMPTPFGQDIRLDGFVKSGANGLLLSVHNAFNRTAYFPGVDAEWSRTMPGVRLGLRAGIWVQPSNQSFSSATHVVGGKTGLRLGVPLLNGRIEPYGDLEGKTAGWVLGQPYLDANVTARLGLAANL